MTLNIKNKLLIALGALLVVTTAVQLWISSGIQSEQAKNDVDALLKPWFRLRSII